MSEGHTTTSPFWKPCTVSVTPRQHVAKFYAFLVVNLTINGSLQRRGYARCFGAATVRQPPRSVSLQREIFEAGI